MAQLLEVFRTTHRVRNLEFDGAGWEYLAGGTPGSTVIIVPGGGASAESMFAVNAALEAQFRVVSLTVPATVTTVPQFIGGFGKLMDSLAIRRAFLLGHSLGGMLVQAFAARHPERVQGLVLSNTGFYLGARARLMPPAASLLAHLPASWSIALVTKQLDRLIANSAAADFWRGFYQDELHKPSAGERIRAQYLCLADVLRCFGADPIRPRLEWVRRMPALILASEDDRGFTLAERSFLPSLYGKAQVHTFPPGTGHLSFLTRAHEYVDLVGRFIAAAALPEH